MVEKSAFRTSAVYSGCMNALYLLSGGKTMKKFHKITAAILSAVVVLSAAASFTSVDAQAAVSDYTGKTIAVTGDSISSFAGVIPSTYDFSYPEGEVAYPNQTWWGIVIDSVKAKRGMICGSNMTTVAGNSLETRSKVGCSMKRVFDVGAVKPDVIFVYLGVNDLLQDIPLGSYYAGKPVVAEGEVNNFADGYNMMIVKLKALYPNAQIICMTCPMVTSYTDYATKAGASVRKNKLGLTINDYNNVIRQVSANYGCKLIDAYYCGLTAENAALFTREGIHPNGVGMQLIANYILMSL